MRKIDFANFQWLDILNPTKEDTKFLKEKFGFHDLILEEVKVPTYHPLLQVYDNYLFWITHFPDTIGNQIHTIELDFLITKDALVTVRYGDFPDFEEVFALIERNKDFYSQKTTGHLFYYLTNALFEKTFPDLDAIQREIDKNEDTIFHVFDKKTIEKITFLKRQTLDFLRVLKPQKSIWEQGVGVATRFWGEELMPYFSDLLADYYRTLHLAEIHREAVDSLDATANALLSVRQGEIIKLLTIFTAILLPLSLLASVFGMNFLYLPFANHPFAFWGFLFATIALTILMLFFFHKKKWF